MDVIMESVPNFSEGRDLEKVEKIASAFRARPGVRLIDYSSDASHNRCVITAIGEPEALRRAVVEAIGTAAELIDLTRHTGEHPRMGAADVVPFIPLRGCDMADADRVAREAAREAAERFGIPMFLYEHSASAPERAPLENVRRGQFEGLADKLRDPLWRPDFGPAAPHPTAGATAIGARMPLIAYNINLATADVDIAKAIARRIRNSGGGYRHVKALGVMLEPRHTAQVTINMTDYTRTALYSVFEAVKTEAARWGVAVTGSEIIGEVPLQALVDTAEYYLRLENFQPHQVLESNILSKSAEGAL